MVSGCVYRASALTGGPTRAPINSAKKAHRRLCVDGHVPSAASWSRQCPSASSCRPVAPGKLPGFRLPSRANVFRAAVATTTAAGASFAVAASPSLHDRGSLVGARRAIAASSYGDERPEARGRDDENLMGSNERPLPPSRSAVRLKPVGDGVAHGDECEQWEAALLITGTAVGGGSLALPYFCAAGGFLPAVSLLLARVCSPTASPNANASFPLFFSPSNPEKKNFLENDENLGRFKFKTFESPELVQYRFAL